MATRDYQGGCIALALTRDFLTIFFIHECQPFQWLL